MGGNSLSAMNIISLIQEQFSVCLSLRNFLSFQRYTLWRKKLKLRLAQPMIV
nr:acyl carrier protein [Legionella tunisiensis]